MSNMVRIKTEHGFINLAYQDEHTINDIYVALEHGLEVIGGNVSICADKVTIIRNDTPCNDYVVRTQSFGFFDEIDLMFSGVNFLSVSGLSKEFVEGFQNKPLVVSDMLVRQPDFMFRAF